MPVDSLERTDEVYRGFVCGRLHITIHDREHLAIVRAFAAKLGAVLPVHVEVDTGMRRGGCRVEEASHVVRAAAAGGGEKGSVASDGFLAPAPPSCRGGLVVPALPAARPKLSCPPACAACSGRPWSE